MKQKARHRASRKARAAHRQQVFLRAVVGSLVLCAAVSATPIVPAQTVATGSHPRSESRQNPEHFVWVHHFDAEGLRAFRSRASVLLNRLRDDGQLKVGENFTLGLEGDRGDDGKLTNLEFTGAAASDAKWQEFARELASSMNDGGVFRPLKDTSRVALSLTLDGRNAALSAVSTLSSEESAQRQAKDYKALLTLVRSDGFDLDIAVVLNNMLVSANGKRLSMRLEMSREQAGNLLRRYVSLP